MEIVSQQPSPKKSKDQDDPSGSENLDPNAVLEVLDFFGSDQPRGTKMELDETSEVKNPDVGVKLRPMEVEGEEHKISVPVQNMAPRPMKYEHLDNIFLINSKDHQPVQYCSIYSTRLALMRPVLLKKMQKMRWIAGPKDIVGVIKLRKDVMSTIIGLVYKEMKLKPSAFDESRIFRKKSKSEIANSGFRTVMASMVSEDDQMFIEDKSGRVEIDFSGIDPVSNTGFDSYAARGLKTVGSRLDKNDFVTGQVVAIRGTLNSKGILLAKQVSFAGLMRANQDNTKVYQELSSLIPNITNHQIHGLEYYLKKDLSSQFVAFVSGLNISFETGQRDLDRLKEFLCNGVTSLGPVGRLAKRITRLVIAGESIKVEEKLEKQLRESFKVQEIYEEIMVKQQQSLLQFDNVVKDFVKCMEVNVMPGEKDPSDAFFPQQPMDKSFLPSSYQFETLRMCCNPHQFKLENRLFLGTSGQNIHDIMKYSSFSDDDLEILEATLLWRHLCPTAPDTLRCHSLTDEDPFFVSQLPSVYFSGNAQRFDTKLIACPETQSFVRLLTIPRFSETQKIVLVNLATLDCFDLKIC